MTNIKFILTLSILAVASLALTTTQAQAGAVAPTVNIQTLTSKNKRVTVIAQVAGSDVKKSVRAKASFNGSWVKMTGGLLKGATKYINRPVGSLVTVKVEGCIDYPIVGASCSTSTRSIKLR